MLTSQKGKIIVFLGKYIYFFIGFLILALAEMIVRYSGISWNYTLIYYLIPLVMSPVIYLISTEWALLFAGLITGTVAFLFGGKNGE